MALFSKKTTEKKKVGETKTATKTKALAEVHPLAHGIYDVLRGPRITEKATYSSEKGVYVFDVNTNATKHAIAKAISHKYKVMPVKVTVINNKSKRKFVRGKWGKTAASRKAYVYLKKGDKIEII